MEEIKAGFIGFSGEKEIIKGYKPKYDVREF
jgi:hypothetical protein